LIAEFSKYIIGPSGQQFEKQREIITVSKNNLNYNWVTIQLASLQDMQEFGINSLVLIDNIKYHIPMIDFEPYTNEEFFSSSLSFIVKELELTDIWCFRSGNAYHAYGAPLLQSNDWYQYLGKLLTISTELPPADKRWIGHSLKRGYSVLRWTRNTNRYKQTPTFLCHIRNNVD
jgi:hypothetical protein